MEFNERLQNLRKARGLTQEELSQALFVSRTAVSKWESGRGYPNIESLKATAKFFGVTIDELLSGDELLTIAEEDTKQKERNFRDLVFGLLDCSVLLLFFVPFFGQMSESAVEAVSLIALDGISVWLKILYFSAASGIFFTGLITLCLQNCRKALWLRNKSRISLILGAAGTLLFIVSQQPYAAAFLFVFFIIKALMLIKKS